MNGLPAHDVVPFVELGQEDGVEEDGPDAVVRLLQSDVVVRERLRNEEQSMLEAKRSAGRDLLHQEVPGIFLGRELSRVRPGRGRVVRRWRVASQVLVRPFHVVLAAKGVERPLLRGGIGPWRANGGALQRPVHALMRAVLLRSSRMDALMLNAEPHPPDIELRQAMDAGRGERHPVVGADGQGQSILAEGALEERFDADALRREEAPTGEEETRVLIGNREGIAPDAVARGELSLEVGRPQIVRRRGDGRHHPRVLMWAPAPSPDASFAPDTDAPPRRR